MKKDAPKTIFSLKTTIGLCSVMMKGYPQKVSAKNMHWGLFDGNTKISKNGLKGKFFIKKCKKWTFLKIDISALRKAFLTL